VNEGCGHANVAVMETEEVESLASFPQVHNPRLGVLERESELAGDGLKAPARSSGPPARYGTSRVSRPVEK